MNAVRLLLGTLRRRGTARPRGGMGVALARRSGIDSYVFVVRVGAGGLVGMGPRL